jgi:hypothetical protein
VPVEPEHRATWLRGALILERHHLNIDHDPLGDRPSLLGGSRERAEARARLAVVLIPSVTEPVRRQAERDIGPDLVG